MPPKLQLPSGPSKELSPREEFSLIDRSGQIIVAGQNAGGPAKSFHLVKSLR
jgi:hypothetical protein